MDKKAILQETNSRLKGIAAEKINKIYDELFFKSKNTSPSILERYLIDSEQSMINMMLIEFKQTICSEYINAFLKIGYPENRVDILWQYVNDRMQLPRLESIPMEKSRNILETVSAPSKPQSKPNQSSITTKDISAIACVATGGIMIAVSAIPTIIGVGFLVASGIIVTEQLINDDRFFGGIKLYRNISNKPSSSTNTTSQVNTGRLKAIIDFQSKLTNEIILKWLDNILQYSEQIIAERPLAE